MRWTVLTVGLVACDFTSLGDTTCDGREWDGGGSLVDAGATLEEPTSDWAAGLDDASRFGPGVSFTEASCSSGTYDVETDDDGAEEVVAALWNLADRSLGEPVPLKASRDVWSGEVPGGCGPQDAVTVVAMPTADGVFGRPSGSLAGDITGFSSIGGFASTNVRLHTDDKTDLVELLVLDLENGTASGPTALKQVDDSLSRNAWEVRSKDRICREDGDFLIFGFIASRRGKVTGAWSL